MQITQEIVKSLFDYSADGFLIWKAGQNKGKICNCIDKAQGYRRVRINRKLYKNSRVIFLYFNGYLPKIVDHINRNRLDDRIENLRACDDTKNARNCNLDKRSLSGKTGVEWHKQRGYWTSRITVDRKKIYIGKSKDLNEAIKMRKEAELKYYGELSPA